MSQCGNFMTFLSFRFSVKSIWGTLEVHICHYNTFRGSEIWFFMNFCTFWILIFTKLAKFTALKIAKMAFFELLQPSKSISRKIWVTENCWIFHTVHVHPAKCHTVEIAEIYSHRKNISSNHLFSDFFSRNVTFTKFLLKESESKFP